MLACMRRFEVAYSEVGVVGCSPTSLEVGKTWVAALLAALKW